MACERGSAGDREEVLDALVRKGIDLCRNQKLEVGFSYLSFVQAASGSHGVLPSVFYSWLGYGMACFEGGRYVEGLELCRRAVEAGPVEADNHLNLAHAHLLLHRVDAALAAVDRGLEVCPDSVALSSLRDELTEPTANPGGSFLGFRKRAAVRVAAAEERARGLAMELWTERQEHFGRRTHDRLTGLLERTTFLHVAQPALDLAVRGREATALFLVALDGFRAVNETYGVARGDEVLAACARVVEDAAGSAPAARVGGDAFALIVSDAEGEAGFARLASRLIGQISDGVPVGADVGPLRASVGIAVCPRDGGDVATVLVRAESASRRAKQHGGGRCRFFSQPPTTLVTKGASMESRLRQAMQHDELSLFYQPIRDGGSRRVVGTEAFVRWLHPQAGPIPPSRFIRMAEETGLIVPLGEWILRAALSQWKRWQRAGLVDFPLSVNFSERQLRYPKQVRRVSDILHELEMKPSSLRVEITEGNILHDTSPTLSSLEALSRMGIRLGLDDFGTGYSSLRLLRRVRFSHLKIGVSFVHDIGSARSGAEMSGAIIAMAHRLGQRVVGTSVETEDQLRYLLEHGCDEIQGRLLGREMPADEFEGLLRDEAIVEEQPRTVAAIAERRPVAVGA